MRSRRGPGRTTHRPRLGLARVGGRFGAPILLAAAPAAAQSTPSSGGGSSIFSDLAPWIAVLGLIAIVGGAIMIRMRRRLDEPDAGPGVGFTLHDLREMHARGELTDEEFQRARDAIVDGVRRAAERATPDGESA